MSTSANLTAIESLFDTGWAATTLVRYDNVQFDVADVPDGSSWVSLEVWDGKSARASVGCAPALRRSFGTVFVTVYAPSDGTGTKVARALADQVADVFRDIQVSGITFDEPSPTRAGEVYYPATGGNSSATGRWWQIKVAIPFEADVFV